jgi:hypothetical protein
MVRIGRLMVMWSKIPQACTKLKKAGLIVLM